MYSKPWVVLLIVLAAGCFMLRNHSPALISSNGIDHYRRRKRRRNMNFKCSYIIRSTDDHLGVCGKTITEEVYGFRGPAT
jgi:hypothetical protein